MYKKVKARTLPMPVEFLKVLTFVHDDPSLELIEQTKQNQSKKWYWEDCKSQLKTYNLYDQT